MGEKIKCVFFCEWHWCGSKNFPICGWTTMKSNITFRKSNLYIRKMELKGLDQNYWSPKNGFSTKQGQVWVQHSTWTHRPAFSTFMCHDFQVRVQRSKLRMGKRPWGVQFGFETFAYFRDEIEREMILCDTDKKGDSSSNIVDHSCVHQNFVVWNVTTSGPQVS